MTAKVFDWNKAARLIAERKPVSATAGLLGDWKIMHLEIWHDGAPLPYDGSGDMYFASVWATPAIEIDGEVIECFVMQNEAPEWNSDTYWPGNTAKIAAG